MAAPDSIVANFPSGKRVEINPIEGLDGSWGEILREWGVHKYQNLTWSARNSPHTENFELHCQVCLDLGCDCSILTKPPQAGSYNSDFRSNLTGIYKHKSVSRDGHNPKCPCYSNSPNTSTRRSGMRQTRRQEFVEFRLDRDPSTNHRLSGHIRLQTTGNTRVDDDLEDELLDELDKWRDDGVIEDPNVSNITQEGIVVYFKKLPDLPTIKLRSSTQLPGNPNTYVVFTEDITTWNNLRFWKASNKSLGYINPMQLMGTDPQKVYLDQSDSRVYLADPSPDSRQGLFTNLNNSGKTIPLIQGHPLGNEIRLFDEDVLRRSLSQVTNLNNFGLEINRAHPNLVEVEHIPLQVSGNTSDPTNLLVMKNNSDKVATIRIQFLPFLRGLTRSELDSEIMSSMDYKDLDKSKIILKEVDFPEIQPRQKQNIFLSLEGTGELRCTQLYSSENKLKTDEVIFLMRCSGHKSDSFSIIRKNPKWNRLSPNQKTKITRITLGSSGISGMDDWKHPDEVA